MFIGYSPMHTTAFVGKRRFKLSVYFPMFSTLSVKGTLFSISTGVASSLCFQLAMSICSGFGRVNGSASLSWSFTHFNSMSASFCLASIGLNICYRFEVFPVFLFRLIQVCCRFPSWFVELWLCVC